MPTSFHIIPKASSWEEGGREGDEGGREREREDYVLKCSRVHQLPLKQAHSKEISTPADTWSELTDAPLCL